MNRYRYLIPSFLGTLLLLIYVPWYLIDRLLISYGEKPLDPDGFVFLFGVVAALHGAGRVFRFHPAMNKAYFNWLVLTPWDSSKPLPRGPAHLVWVDLVVLGILSLLAYPKVGYDVWIIPSVFLGTYLFFLNLALVMQGQNDCLSISVFVIPLLWWPLGCWTILPGLIILYGLAYWGLQQQMKQYPWNTGWWKDDPIQQWKAQAGQPQCVGWPFRPMMTTDFQGISILQAIMIAFLITWWIHSISFYVGFPDVYFMTFMAVLFLGVLRLVLYEVGSAFRSPIGFWARIFTGYWIIPGYDQILLANFLSFSAFVLVLVLDRVLPGPSWLYHDLGLFLSMFSLFACPPSLEKWRLTGSFRIQPRMVRQSGSSSPKSLDQILGFLISGSSTKTN